MIRTFIKNSTIYFTSNAINKILGLAFFAYVARVLTIEEMGAYGLLNVAVTILALLMTLEVQSGFSRYYLDCPEQDRKTFELSTINVLLLVNVALGALFFLLHPLMASLLIPIDLPLYLVLLALPCGMGVSAVCLAKLRLENRAFSVAVVSVLQLLVHIGGTLLLLWLGADKLLAIFVGVFVGNLFVMLWYGVDIRPWRPIADLSSIRQSIVFSALLVPANIGIFLTLLTGKYVVAKLLDLEAVGIYEVCSRVAIIIRTIMMPILQATRPIIYEQYQQESFPPRFYKLLHIHMLILLGLVIAFSLFNREIVYIIVGTQYVCHAHYLYPFIMAAVLLHMTGFFVFNVHLAQKTQYVSLIEIITGVLNAGATFLLIQRFAFLGAVIAILVVYASRYLMYLCFANGLYPRLRISQWMMTGYLSACALLLAAHFLLRDLPMWGRGLLGMLEGGLALLGFMKLHKVPAKQVLSLLRRR